MNNYPIPANDFVSAMEARWTGALGNASSRALRETWRQLGEAFNAHCGEASPDWTVLQPATGTGKSQGAALYASMLSKLTPAEHPGVLLVKRLTAEADAAAELINTLSGEAVAAAYHSKNDVGIDALRDFPVAAITQRAFLLAIDDAASVPDAWHRLTQWAGGERRLIIIDEALDIVDEAEVTLSDLQNTLGNIPRPPSDEYAEDYAVLERVVELLEICARDQAGARRAMVCEDLLGALGLDKAPRFEGLLGALEAMDFERRDGDSEDLARRRTIRRRHEKRIKTLRRQLAAWLYLSRQGDQHRLSHARSMIPESARGAVVLDATADCNRVYEVRGIYPQPAAPDARNYSNVTVHTSHGHRVGKEHLTQNAATESAALVDALAKELPAKRKVLFCCHKDVEPVLRGFLVDAPFESCVGHWGAIDGSNDWRACDTVVIFGLPYPPDLRAANVFSALQGMQSTEWLQAEERRFGSHLDILRTLRHDHIVSSVVQAIGRARCRRVVDAEGRCLPTDVYLLLPSRDRALTEAIVAGIRQSMPGVRLESWGYAGAGRHARQRRRDEYLRAILAYIPSVPEGVVPRHVVERALGIPRQTMVRIWRELSELPETALRELGVALGAHGNRRWFEKVSG